MFAPDARSLVNLDDISQALVELGTSPQDLEEYVQLVRKLPITTVLVKSFTSFAHVVIPCAVETDDW